MSEPKKGYIRRAIEAVRNTMWGIPEKTVEPKKAGTLVLGAIEQNYGIYQIPPFRDMVTTFWGDSVLREGIQDFGEQVVATGYFLTCNQDYNLKLPVFDKQGNKVGDLSAMEAIDWWCRANDVEEKLLEIGIELRAFGNSFWRISNNGFSKIPIEAVWHAVRVEPNVPLQEQYHIQFVPIYGGAVIKWGEFIHFRIYITGYRAPFGMGLMHSLLARPTMQDGTVVPSIYDIRLSLRASLDEGFRKFSFGNVWVSVEGLPEDKVEAFGKLIEKQKSTGNRMLTNLPTHVQLEVPTRTEAYDKFIENMRNEFYMSLGDPMLKLGLEEGFTKSTAETAAQMYKFKIAAVRQSIKHNMEKLFVQILNKLGFDGMKAKVEINFEKEEVPEYASKDIYDAHDRGIITKNEGRYLLEKYIKWDIHGKIEGGDIPLSAPVRIIPRRVPPSPLGTVTDVEKPADIGDKTAVPEKVQPEVEKTIKQQNEPLKEGVAMVIHEKWRQQQPQVEIAELPDSLAGYNDQGKIYLDPIPLLEGYPRELLMLHEGFEYPLVVVEHIPYPQAHQMAQEYEHAKATAFGYDWAKLEKLTEKCLEMIKLRHTTNYPKDLVRV